MIKQWIYGSPLPDFALAEPVDLEKSWDVFPASRISKEETGLQFLTELFPGDRIFGLGETMRGIDKRGGRYVSYNTDDANHRHDMPSLYASHNFFVVVPREGDPWGLFFDTPARTVFDMDSGGEAMLRVTVESFDLRLVYVTGGDPLSICRQFLQVIGQSFLPPLWAFGFGQSRWGYSSSEDVRRVVKRHQEEALPLDYVCLDIGYMDRYIDFSVDKKKIPDLKALVLEMKEQGIRLVPIIDAGVKVEPGNPVYDEGVARGYFCVNKQGEPFQAAVWPGMTHFPDFFQPEASRWFGDQYRVLTDQGIEGFWNDMNEPSIFYSEASGHAGLFKLGLSHIAPRLAERLAMNTRDDYRYFYHRIGGKTVCHHDVHNLYGALMTRASAQGLQEQVKGRYLLFSRSSYIGAHRYGGIWTGDNYSSWEMLRQNVKQMPGMNMCGFLYSGADTGGFGGNCTRQLLLRWLAFSVFTPLMRDHSATMTREQETYAFGDTEAFRRILSLRYYLLPFLYSEFMKAALRRDMLFRPLCFDFPKDPMAARVEDQLMLGESLMVTPIVREDTDSRQVYLPEDMTMVRFANGEFLLEERSRGMHRITVPEDEVVFFVRKGRGFITAAKAVSCTRDLDLRDVRLITGDYYDQYLDDGMSRQADLSNIRRVRREER